MMWGCELGCRMVRQGYGRFSANQIVHRYAIRQCPDLLVLDISSHPAVDCTIGLAGWK